MQNRVTLPAVLLVFSLSIGALKISAAPDGITVQSRKVVTSPDDKISLVFDLTGGTPSYAVNFKGQPVILSSALGFELKDGAMKTGFTLLDTAKSSRNETWTQPWGEQREIRNHYNELAVNLH